VNQVRDYELVLTPPARGAARAIPEPVAAAVLDVLTTALVQDPRRVGKPLRGDLVGIWTARRGTDRVLYRWRDPREVIVVRIEHRRHADRPT
jgi:mRNA interferase RelE/StbE